MPKIKNSITPLHDRVIIQPEEAKKVTKGGIIIPDTAKEKPLQGKVLAVGIGKKDEPMTVKLGDIVLYNKHSGMSIIMDEKECLIMKESDVLAIL
mgnify:CR=1 FL=1